MKLRNLLNLIFVVIVLGLLSCEKEGTNPEINAEEYYGDGSFFISLARLKSPDIRGNYCGTPQVYELRLKYNLKAFGTVAIFSDGRFLNLQFDLLQERINDGWGIDRTLIWVGLSKDWIDGKDGPKGGWGGVPGIDIASYTEYPTFALHQIPLEDWMFDKCFLIAARVTVRDPNWVGEAADGFINYDSRLTYSWNEPFCLEKCNDLGTSSPDYWKNNPDAWLGGVTVGGIFYSIEGAIEIMKSTGVTGDITYNMFEQIVASKLNVAIGNTSYCITKTIELADIWMEDYGPVGNGISINNPVWIEGGPLFTLLDDYNNGRLCADPKN